MKNIIIYKNSKTGEEIFKAENHSMGVPIFPGDMRVTIDNKEYVTGETYQVIHTDILEATITVELRPNWIEQQFTVEDFPVDVIDYSEELYRFGHASYENSSYVYKVLTEHIKCIPHLQDGLTESRIRQTIKGNVDMLTHSFRFTYHMSPDTIPEKFNEFCSAELIKIFNTYIEKGYIEKIK